MKKKKEKKEPDYFEALNLESGFSLCPAVKMLTTVDREVGVTGTWSKAQNIIHTILELDLQHFLKIHIYGDTEEMYSHINHTR